MSADRGKSTAAATRKQKVIWSPNAEAKLIELWADVLGKYDGKMMTKKSKEKIVTQQLNDYCDQVSLQHFSESEVRNRIDSIVKKAKGIYAQYRLPKETGRETDDADIALDEEAAKLAWPNFAVFIAHFRNHPSLGPGSVDDASLLPNLPLSQRTEEDLFVTTGVVAEEAQHPLPTRSRPTTPSSRTSTPVQPPLESSSDNDAEEEAAPKAKKKRKAPKAPRVGTAGSQLAFIQAMTEMQESSQRRQFEHDQAMQLQLQQFEERRERERERQQHDREIHLNEEEMRKKMSQESQIFQTQLMQQQQAFQAELFKRLFSDKQ
ncbi:uncharacterized protein LOC134181747 [Corticium candelabrum]|uniref:uncharacterized protein LOC134181747 n=1 Tax=Corticium candelabrum TaxID=121492 RepID=UPI002E255507|nr:uncharacterized protein LOC134181747 [Corticium candelabrum]